MGPVDLSFTLPIEGEGMTMSLVDRQSGRVLRTLEIMSPSVAQLRRQSRSGHIIDLSA